MPYTVSEASRALNRSFVVSGLLLLCCILLFICYVWAEKKIDQANESRATFPRLIQEFRQSSDDLTRMALLYIATADPRYKTYYDEILAIQDGYAPRPEQPVFWELPQSTQAWQLKGRRLALLTLMQDAGFSADELSAVMLAKKRAEELIRIERQQMSQLDMPGLEPSERRQVQQDSLFRLLSDEQFQLKASVMQPLADTQTRLEQRTRQAVSDAMMQAFWLRLAFISVTLVLCITLYRSRQLYRRLLGATPSELSTFLQQFGQPKTSKPLRGQQVPPGSILACLVDAEAQQIHQEEQRQQLIAELQQQQQYLRALFDSLPLMVWFKDLQGRYLAVNRRFAMMLQRDVEEIQGKSDSELFDPQQALMYISHDKNVLQQDLPDQVLRQLMIDGEPRWLDVYKTPVYLNEQSLGVVGTARDVTTEHNAETQLRLSASVFTHAREGIMITDPHGVIIDVNQAFCQITGYSPEQAKNCTPRLLKSDRQDEHTYQHMWQVLHEQGYWAGEVWSRRANSEDYMQSLTMSAVRDEQQQVRHYVGLLSDITQQHQQQQQLEKIALFDQLTGLPNRNALIQQLQQLLQMRDKDEWLAIAYLDLDGFKEINDRHGHATGDKLLLQVAQRLRKQLDRYETLARIGGDEFVLLLPALTDHNQGCQRIEQLLAQIATPVQIDDWMLSVSASIGITFAPQPEAVDAEQLIRQADHAMYQAKQDGKNRYQLFDVDKARSMRGHQETLQDIRQALELEQFELFYQPKVNMRSGELIGSEALIRWRHPERGLVPPGLFLPAIEQHSLGVTLGYWVMERAIRQLAEWQQQGWVLPVSVNISAYHLQQPDFVNRLQQLLRRYQQVSPALLQLEILETGALNDLGHVQAVMQACLRAGVSFALDDFGTGYSSLTYLKRLPAQVLKIDQSFVRDMLTDPDDLAILRGILVLAAEFKRDIVAEGVETTEHGEALLALGCELAQGYGIARPMPAADFEHWRHHWLPPAEWRCTGAP
ncbi:EAL domain-containing protein [Rheinheimera sp.]|uniref:putative bifunctional diguanylate cyclase/phosphodiesterase n=1 Tax=Rheinheimera sp. TaxID=1869214 RepID=UPI00307DEA4F